MRPEFRYVHDRHARYGISPCMSTVPCEAWTLHELSHWSVLFEGQRPADVSQRVVAAILDSPDRPSRDLQEVLAIAVELCVSDWVGVNRDLWAMYQGAARPCLLDAAQLRERVEAAMKTEDTKRRAGWLTAWITQESSSSAHRSPISRKRAW